MRFHNRNQCRHEQNRRELYGKKRERNAYKNNRTSQISTRYYPNFKCISIFPLQTEKQSTEVLQELNKNFIIHSELSA